MRYSNDFSKITSIMFTVAAIINLYLWPIFIQRSYSQDCQENCALVRLIIYYYSLNGAKYWPFGFNHILTSIWASLRDISSGPYLDKHRLNGFLSPLCVDDWFRCIRKLTVSFHPKHSDDLISITHNCPASANK